MRLKITTAGRFAVSATLALLLALPTGLAVAQDAKQIKRSIQYRQGVFRVLVWDFGPMAGMAKGKIPFDAADFARRAERVAAMAPRALEGFGANTNIVDGTPTRAKDEIWANTADFEEKMQALVDATAQLAKVAAGGDEAAMKAQLGETGKTCKGCHDDYRSKEYR